MFYFGLFNEWITKTNSELCVFGSNDIKIKTTYTAWLISKREVVTDSLTNGTEYKSNKVKQTEKNKDNKINNEERKTTERTSNET